MVGKLLRQSFVGCVRLGDDEEAGRILVDPVNDPGARHAIDAGQLPLTVKQQCVDQRTVPIARRRMDYHPRRLVYDDEVLIFEDDIQRNVLRFGCQHLGGGKADGISGPFLHLCRTVSCGRTVDLDSPGGNQTLYPLPR